MSPSCCLTPWRCFYLKLLCSLRKLCLKPKRNTICCLILINFDGKMFRKIINLVISNLIKIKMSKFINLTYN